MKDPLLEAMKSEWMNNSESKQKPIKPSERGKKQRDHPGQKPPPIQPDISETDLSDQVYTLQDKKTYEEGRGKEIDNEVKTGNLFLRSLMKSIMADISHSIQINFVDVPRRESPTLAAKWGIPNKEREIENDLTDIIEASINGVIGNIETLSEDGVYE